MPTAYLTGVRRPLKDLYDDLMEKQQELDIVNSKLHEKQAQLDLKDSLLGKQSKMLIDKDNKIDSLKEEVKARELTIQNMYKVGWRI
ncbi:hypothetical protein [Apilactobacillus quenuiae]|uniref:hypothetical protein n=1 Tax=Apilactobacillus quenuiae TaxID=2008377 RepID=UPI000D01C5A9|nr:hypothetical protein [Apilactobacillus quenuiae]